MSRLPIVALAVVLCAVPVGAIQLPIRTYTTVDGLARNAVECIVPDAQGFLWLCTSEGLSRFDGAVFDSFGVAQGLPNRVVYDFLRTNHGALLAAGSKGVSRIDPLAPPGSGRQFLPIDTRDGSPPLGVFALFQDSTGAVWAGTVGGIYRVVGPDSPHPSLEYIPLSEMDMTALSFANDGAGGLSIGASNGLWHRAPDGRLSRVSRQGPVNTLLFDKQQRLWAGTLQGLMLFTDSRLRSVLTQKNGLASERIHALFQASDGTVWVGTAAGLSELPTSSPLHFRSYGQKEGLRGRTVLAIRETNDGSLWAAVDHGLARIAPHAFVRYSEADGIGEISVPALIEDRAGTLFAVSNQPDGPRLHRFDGTRFAAIRPRYPATLRGSGSGWDQIALKDRTGEWWFATGQGVYRFPAVAAEQLPRTAPKAIYTVRNGLPGDDVARLFEDSSGGIWISAVGGLTRWDRSTASFHTFSKTEIGDGLASSFAEDNHGDIWIGSSHNPGLGQRCRLLRYRNGRLENPSSDPLPEGWILKLFIDSKRRLWIATADGGLIRVNDPAAAHLKFLSYTRAQGLSGPGASGITEDRQGRIYVLTAQGVDRLDPDSGGFRHYSSAEGLPDSGLSTAHTDREGRVWVGSALGLASLLPVRELPATPPAALIKSLAINGRAHSLIPPDLVFSPAENQIRIDFAAPESSSTLFQYRLSDSAWSLPTTERTVNFSNLPPGGYIFEVRAAGGYPAHLAFKILPHFWQRWWFLLLCTTALGVFAWVLHAYDVDRRLEVERVRARIAADLHDDLGATLSRVAILSEVAQRGIAPADSQTSRRLAEIAAAARSLIDSIGDLVWSIDPLRDDVRSLLSRIRQVAWEVFEPLGIAWSLEAGREIENTPLPSGSRWQLFLIVKEALNNAAKHSGCRNVRIVLESVGGYYRMEIRDDGRGLNDLEGNIAGGGDGNGLANMRRRAAALGGELKIRSAPGQGVFLTLSAPLKKRA